MNNEEKASIEELLKITNATESSEEILNLFVEQLIGNVNNPEFSNILEKEIKDLIHEEVVVKRSLHSLMCPIYCKYLTLEEIDDLVWFYKTILGQKLISVKPKIDKEVLEASQIWGQELGLKLQQKMSDILEKE